MTHACPISNESIDERAARLCALIVLVPLGLSVLFASPWPGLLLAVDFGLRAFGLRRHSPLARLSRALVGLLGGVPRPTNAAPKAFAAKLGLGFSLAVAVSFLTGQASVAVVFAAPFAFCAGLEGVLGYCVGCRVFQVWQRLRRPGPSLSAQP